VVKSAATQPEISMTEDEKEAEKILSGARLTSSSPWLTRSLPSKSLILSGFKVVREVVEVTDEEVEEQVLRVAENSRSAIEPKTGKAADGDRVTIDYLGKVDGEAFRWRCRSGRRTGDWLEPLHPRI
jgi:trigger factor